MAKTRYERHGGNPKIESPGYVAKWARFRGFSLLFDNPDIEFSKNKRYQPLDSNVDMIDSLEFYRALRDALDELDINWLVNSASFCPLPSNTYHVTVWDGLNDGNAGDIDAEQRNDLLDFFDRLPDRLNQDEQFTRPVYDSTLLTMKDLNITFKFGKLANWGNIALLCVLDIVDEDRDVFARIADQRKILANLYRERFGIALYNEWVPHITLGYLYDPQAGSNTLAHIENWSGHFKGKTDGLTITYQQIGLYGFTDMATFIKYV